MPAVILAAGIGSRLAGAARGLPKALVPVCGRPLLSYALEGLALAGVREAHVGVGHRGAEVRAALGPMNGFGIDISPVENVRYRLPNGSSLAAAHAAVGNRPFLLLMADHLFSDAAIDLMLQSKHGFAIGVDRGPMPVERLTDATRVQMGTNGLVKRFSKRLRRWDAIDAGIFRCLPSVFDAIAKLGEATELSAIMTAVAGREPFHTVDLTGSFWLDVDTPADLAAAESLLGNWAVGSRQSPVRLTNYLSAAVCP